MSRITKSVYTYFSIVFLLLSPIWSCANADITGNKDKVASNLALSQEKKTTDFQSTQKRVKAIVVLDAGHGGIDPGAQANNVIEKHIVFSITNMLFKMLDNDPSFEVKATRHSDKKVSLTNRVKQANREKADVFISIHADALPTSPNIKGSSVYTLSEKASDRLANRLALNQNVVDGFNIDRDLPSDLKKALSDIQLQAKNSQSDLLAKIMLKSLSKIGPVAFKKTHSANFAVLRSSIASILIETGFITNKEDAQRLSSKVEQRRIAKAIYKGLREYKNKHLIARHTLPILGSEDGSEEKKYRVIKGDTLYHISQLFNVRVIDLKKRNRLKSNTINAGQMLIIPTK